MMVETIATEAESTVTVRSESAPNFLQRPIGGTKTRTKPDKAAAFGQSPRAHLLPPEVLQGNKEKARQRGLWLGALAAAIVVALSCGAAFAHSVSSQQALADAQAETLSLQAEQAALAEVRDVKSNLSLSGAARRVGGSTDIDWKDYLSALQATLPVGVTITSVETESASPIADYAQSMIPLEGSRVGTLSFEALSPTLPSIPEWLDALTTLEGFVDAVPNSVVISDNGEYTVSITMHVNAEAFSGKYVGDESDK
jgi:hypothetical protein